MFFIFKEIIFSFFTNKSYDIKLLSYPRNIELIVCSPFPPLNCSIFLISKCLTFVYTYSKLTLSFIVLSPHKIFVFLIDSSCIAIEKSNPYKKKLLQCKKF